MLLYSPLGFNSEKCSVECDKPLRSVSQVVLDLCASIAIA